jgi:hypothetical protein
MATSFSGGRSRGEPPTMGKQLVNFILYELLGNPTTIEPPGTSVKTRTTIFRMMCDMKSQPNGVTVDKEKKAVVADSVH